MFVFFCTVLSVPCGIVVTAGKGLTSLLSCVLCFLCFCHFPYGVPGQVWYLIVSGLEFCIPFYFVHTNGIFSEVYH